MLKIDFDKDVEVFFGALNWSNTQYNPIAYAIDEYNNAPTKYARRSNIESTMVIVNMGLFLCILGMLIALLFLAIFVKGCSKNESMANFARKLLTYYIFITILPYTVASFIQIRY